MGIKLVSGHWLPTACTLKMISCLISKLCLPLLFLSQCHLGLKGGGIEGVVHGRLHCSSIYIFFGTFPEGTNLCGDGLTTFLCIPFLFHHRAIWTCHFCVRTALHCLTKNENIQLKVCGVTSVYLAIKTHEPAVYSQFLLIT